MARLTVTIITLNEEKDLPRCLESIKKLADEIVVVDSGSTDHTVDIARKYTAKVFKRKFDNYANQKNFAAQKASGVWILSLDADEEVESQLASEIASCINNKTLKYCAYSIPRKNIIFGKLIRHSRWQAELDRHVWLWKKGFGQWRGDVHEEVEVDGYVGKMNGAKIHHQYRTLKEFLAMMNRYSEFESEEIIRKGGNFSLFKMICIPKYNFLVRYFYRLGFLDGWRGFTLSYLMAVYHLELWIKIWEKGRR